VEVFLQEVDAAIDRLAPDRPAPDLAADLHFLKGAALNLGFRAFAVLCAAAETAAHAGRTEGIDLDEITGSYVESREAFLTGLAQRVA
jgi:Hpt domain.